MVEVAGYVADRLLCHPTATPSYLAQVVEPALAKGTGRAERPRTSVALQGVVITAISDDVMQARREAAAQIAFYVAPKSYGPMLEVSGFGAAAAAIRGAFKAKDWEGMVRAVPDDMVDAMALTGTADDVLGRLGEFEARYDHTTLYSPSFLLTPERISENTAAIVAHCGVAG
jgi:alkanesulfonate monooxygenase SsuD/methylene tetrahydromethanopterin reductase-like flavin-dependent oxidoreductase (luciferase family)